jgi:hypothetical protein
VLIPLNLFLILQAWNVQNCRQATV